MNQGAYKKHSQKAVTNIDRIPYPWISYDQAKKKKVNEGTEAVSLTLFDS